MSEPSGPPVNPFPTPRPVNADEPMPMPVEDVPQED